MNQMVDSSDLILFGIGVLVGIGIVTVFILIHKEMPAYTPSYVQVSEGMRR